MPTKIPKTLPGIQKIGPTTWAAIWRRWLRDEGQLKKWRRHLQQEGFASWSEWRRAVVVAPFGLSRRRWTLYQVMDPQVVASWSGGPFPRWVAGPYRGARTRTFRWLASSGRSTEERQPRATKALPTQMFMFGLVYRGRIVVLDGMHRSVAIAERLRAKQKIKTKIVIALAKTSKLPKLNRSLQ